MMMALIQMVTHLARKAEIVRIQVINQNRVLQREAKRVQPKAKLQAKIKILIKRI